MPYAFMCQFLLVLHGIWEERVVGNKNVNLSEIQFIVLNIQDLVLYNKSRNTCLLC